MIWMVVPEKRMANLTRLARFGRWTIAALLIGTLAASAQGSAPAASGDPNCCDASAGTCAPPSYTGIRVALLIGNDKYGGALKPLANAGHDAQAMARTLAPYYHYRCVLNADLVTFGREVDAFRHYLADQSATHASESIDGRAIFYFSGHGFSVDNENYLVMSGNVQDKQDLLKNKAWSIASLAFRIGGYVNFKVYLIFDSCRNLVSGQQVDKPDWADRGFAGSAPDYAGQVQIFSTGFQGVALDAFDDQLHDQNGAYMHTLQKYAVFRGLKAAELLLQNIGEDPDMRSRHQIPTTPANSDVYDPFSWAGISNYDPTQQCLFSEAAVVNAIGWCRDHGNLADCLQQTAVCTNRSLMFRSASPLCSPHNLAAAFPTELSTCGPPDAAAPLASLLSVVSLEGTPSLGSSDSIAAAARLQLRAEQKVASVAWRSALAPQFSQVESLRVFPGNKTAPRISTSPIKTQINDLVRSAKGSILDPKFMTRPTVGLASQTFDLAILPSDIGGSTGQVHANGQLKVDCSKLACTENWAMVEVPSPRGPVLAWVPVDKLEPEVPKCAVSLNYEGESIVPLAGDIARIRTLLVPGCIDPNSIIQILVILRRQDDREVLLANERASFVRRSLTSLAGPRIDLTRTRATFVQTEHPGSAAPVTIQILAR